MLKVEERIACTEALKVFDMLEEKDQKKVPQSFVNYLKEHYSDDVFVHVRQGIPLVDQNISPNGWNLIKKLAEYVQLRER